MIEKPMNTMSNYSPTPWHAAEGTCDIVDAHGASVTIGDCFASLADRDRAIECVNCFGRLRSPAESLSALLDAAIAQATKEHRAIACGIASEESSRILEAIKPFIPILQGTDLY